jgi:hypothetical protein
MKCLARQLKRPLNAQGGKHLSLDACHPVVATQSNQNVPTTGSARSTYMNDMNESCRLVQCLTCNELGSRTQNSAEMERQGVRLWQGLAGCNGMQKAAEMVRRQGVKLQLRVATGTAG